MHILNFLFVILKNAIESCECVSANGKGNVLNTLKTIETSGKNYLAIVDGAAFGAELEELIQYMKYNNPSIKVYAPESFEYLILKSELYKSNDIQDKLNMYYLSKKNMNIILKELPKSLILS